MSSKRWLGGIGGVLAAFVVATVFAGCIWLPGLEFPPLPTPGPSAPPCLPTPVVSGVPTEPAPSPGGIISREDAIATARQLATQFPDGDVLQAELARWCDVADMGGQSEGPPPAPNDLVWRISLGYDHGPLNAAGEVLVLLASDGRLLQHTFWIA